MTKNNKFHPGIRNWTKKCFFKTFFFQMFFFSGDPCRIPYYVVLALNLHWPFIRVGPLLGFALHCDWPYYSLLLLALHFDWPFNCVGLLFTYVLPFTRDEKVVHINIYFAMNELWESADFFVNYFSIRKRKMKIIEMLTYMCNAEISLWTTLP